ncbi:MAG: hypothetical protein UV61_C0006G0138 [Candidatus Gottesmanbacteria bacterium GW2011_GWB1_43_11]|uniref:Glycosyl hydrolases family 39 N-terminal catalytic domain-containing protein n=1 Tax=Candidatus Gottesmanbacteria bacterium GW2011_GWB1_43_11 TaxID=1618446 RepID=A0A0G1CN69_9BACT|nr:MAG: hypothetical protein UV04_C0005G0138 [Candidatus Gottesmanbacteria bacterium GW2011_GWA2_42_16]KKS55679.1 MAG: hypothetical protein UV17_C0008G0030 [Candidatus Gottesmanbacteria bacterium GW2011_GWA1_42_26]KKS81470.1 MAG: hypothetical protein UV55_C0013G0012 [Candidatus Gottesmanbacteria bacterium GW2011_GWC1_43_10]KKS86937.1 MAG: hypothetical protein UV61_C0006G0138 [Candidatus Gottesmanbacteria bacterium GW2011_GWB1_43_11]OGG09510.1 MAG: hypothetical protein A2699_03145 [Candidatus Go
MRKRQKLWPIAIKVLLLFLLLPLLLIASQNVARFLIRAGGIKANIVVNFNLTLEPIKPVWNSFSQGGESEQNMLAPVANQIKALSPNYIRIDHIFDHYQLVSRTAQGQLVFDFSQLDATVNSILQSGALPFFSLSYMPQVIAENGDVTGKPQDWNEWALVVQKTIEHYSGKAHFNLTNIYYEVWNEPDFFGGWELSGPKNYTTLYAYAVSGANSAQNVNSFKIGGPATTNLYKKWITSLADFVITNHLRLDFWSWHRYTTDPTQYAKDPERITDWLLPYPDLIIQPRLITEWGFDSEINPGYDGDLAAAHAVASVRQALYGYEGLFAFELVDGLDPQGQTFWGRWGLLTHPSTGNQAKPRYAAFKLLNQIDGTRLVTTGEGTWVTGFATSNDATIQLILVNYDKFAQHSEQVPVQFINLANGDYLYQLVRLGQGGNPTKKISVTQNSFATEVIMPQNSVVLLELTPTASASATPSAT